MRLLFKISFRNLLRQKRRNIFLGLAITIGMAILVITGSFTKGLSDIILNKWLVFSYGHVSVSGYEDGRRGKLIIRDRQRITDLIMKVKGVTSVNNNLNVSMRIIGNDRSATLWLVGRPEKEGNESTVDYFRNSIAQGSADDFTNSTIENPVIMTVNQAKDLNVRIRDNLQISMMTINGQVQAARVTLVATRKELGAGSGIAFYMPLNIMKKLMGYRNYESPSLQVVLGRMDDPGEALVAADMIHNLLKPGIAGYYGEIYSRNSKMGGTVLTFYTNSTLMGLISANLPTLKGEWNEVTGSNMIVLSAPVALKLHSQIGGRIETIYENKFGGSTTNSYKVGAIFKPGNVIGENTLLVSENNFYGHYLENLPRSLTDFRDAFIPNAGNVLSVVLGKEWRLLPRTYTAEELDRKLRTSLRQSPDEPCYDVSSMYEAASAFIDIQRGIEIISMAAVMILFCVILVGVLNTLRMNVKERTREIGTLRAIGMQKEDVKITFILETFYLALFSCIAGIILSVVVICLISLIPVETDSMFGLLLVNKHIHFLLPVGRPVMIFYLFLISAIEVTIIKFGDYIPFRADGFILTVCVLAGFALSGSGNGILTFLLLIMNMLLSAAYFPAKRAAEMHAADALRLYE